ncbi:MAG: HAD family phosphatase [Verrucomicrobiota bacterium]
MRQDASAEPLQTRLRYEERGHHPRAAGLDHRADGNPHPLAAQGGPLPRGSCARSASRRCPACTPGSARCARARIPCVIASSTHRENITTALDVLGLGGFFDAIISAEDVKRGKPDPEVFLTAARRIGVEPAGAVVFEDALVGIAAAQAAGMRVVAVATTEPRDKLAHADRVVGQLDELSVAQVWDGHAAGH